MNRYNNYHKHDCISNIFTPDSNAKFLDYANRALELNEPNCWTTNHGSGGDIFDAKSITDSKGLNCKFAIEGYIVPNPLEKDNRNYHIVLIPRTNIARKKLNKANSRANIEGFYYKPRLFLDDLLNNFDSNELYITTACCAGLLGDEDSINELFYPLYEKFGKNLLLEVQTHTQDIQRVINEKALKFNKELGLYLVGANDSHYIYPEQYKERIELLKGKGITYDDEDSFILDYPDYDTMIDRFRKQGILNNQQIQQAMENTLLFDDCENIYLDKEIKMPTIHHNLNEEEKINLLKNITNKKFTEVMQDDDISKEKIPTYIEEVKKEMQVIEDTKEIHTADYFLFNIKMIDLALNKYNGVLTRTGRGSYSSFLLNKILGLTQIDRLTINLPIYSDRFASASRLLENRSLPDCDFNLVDQMPFIQASRELLGENGCYPMIAYGTMKESEAFRNVCRSHSLQYDEYNEVGKHIDSYRADRVWKQYIDEANQYVGTIISASVHPCSFILMNEDIESEIGVLKIGENICAMITSGEADDWKYLKNDYLIVSVWDIIDKTYKLLNKPIPTIKQLNDMVDDKTWDLFKNGMTCTLNQVDGDWATTLVKKYAPKNIEELSQFVGAIRPSFESFRDIFINRRSYTTGSKELDNILCQTNGMITFQEVLMRYFEWLSITPAESIGLIKKISKKKIKPKDFKDLEERIKKQWIINTGKIDMFQETWDMIQGCLSYGFCSAHAVAVAYDCLYCAYLKSHYPLEYYTVVLNQYRDDKEKTTRLNEECEYYHIKISSPKFRYSQNEYLIDKSTNSIYKGLASIKDIGKNNGDELFTLKDNTYPTFIHLLKDIKEKTKVNSKQLDILIKLDFFSEFGDIYFLLYQTMVYDKFGNSKTIAKAKLSAQELQAIQGCYNKESEKQYREIDNIKFINNLISQNPTRQTTIQDKIKWQSQLLGYIDIIDINAKSNICIAENVEVNRYGTPFITLYQLCNGESKTIKADKKEFNKFKIIQGDMLECLFTAKPKYKKVGIKQDGNPQFAKTGEMEKILSAWAIVRE